MDLTELLTGTDMTLEIVLWSMFAGIVVASFVAVYNRRVVGKVVRELYARGAHYPCQAVTLAELGLERNIFILWALRSSGTLRRVVFEFDPFSGNTDINAGRQKKRGEKNARLRFYIPPEADERAETMYIREGTTIFTALLSIVLFVAIVLFCLAVIPGLVSMVESLSTSIGDYFSK